MIDGPPMGRSRLIIQPLSIGFTRLPWSVEEVLCLNMYGKDRKAVSSIIGGAFLVLIITSGYAFYVLSNRQMNDFQKVLTNMRSDDIDRGQESIRTMWLNYTDTTHLTLKIQNIGTKSVRVTSIGVHDKSGLDEVTPYPEDQYYYPQDVYIEPSRVATFLITVPGLDPFQTDYSYIIQVVTERGNTFESGYPFRAEQDQVVVAAQAALAKVIGDFIPEYHSYSWALRENQGSVYTESDWHYSWWVTPDVPIIFRLNITYYGEGITVGQDSALFFQTIYGSPSHQVNPFYILYVTSANPSLPSYNNELIRAYTYPSFDLDLHKYQNVTLYFGTATQGQGPWGNQNECEIPGGGTATPPQYLTTMGIYDIPSVHKYAQAFTLFAIWARD